MEPILNTIRRQDFVPAVWGKICKCERKCDTGVTFTTMLEGSILCHNEARRLLFSLIKQLDEGGAYTTWSEADEQFIIDHVKRRGGMKKGINREIAEALGKTYEQAKSKTRRMQRAGKLVV